MKVGRAIYHVLGFMQGIVELVGSVRRLVLQARRGTLPVVDDTEPIPLRKPNEPLKRR